jgi:hypothetical protein
MRHRESSGLQNSTDNYHAHCQPNRLPAAEIFADEETDYASLSVDAQSSMQDHKLKHPSKHPRL